MMNSKVNSRIQLLFVLVAAAGLLLTAGCGDHDNPVEGSHEEHLEAFGVRVYDGTTLVSEAHGTTVTGSFEITDGDTSEWLSIEFLNDEGEWYNPAEHIGEHEEEYGLLVEPGGSVAEVIHGDHEPEKEWQFRLAGIAEGEGTLRIKTQHEGHDDYVSPLFDVTVSSPAP
jgi:hypothetical protein